uniref:Ribosomal RNA-processing protein 14/surfeit locus protein 6 C-terminal domain-containing protein n=1 Tax=Globodera rostochiensis TaxID=31243 RepID=A0A914GYC4_GLORO
MPTNFESRTALVTVWNDSQKMVSEPVKNEADDQQQQQKFVFSNLRFVVSEEKSETRRDKRNKFNGRDVRRLLEKAEQRGQRMERIRTNNPQKAQCVERNVAWERAFRRVTGQKVKDNVQMLKKGVIRKAKNKQRRKRKWEERKQMVEVDKEKRMEKKRENVEKRKRQTTEKRKTRKKK